MLGNGVARVLGQLLQCFKYTIPSAASCFQLIIPEDEPVSSFDVKPIYEYLAATDFIGECFVLAFTPTGRPDCGLSSPPSSTTPRRLARAAPFAQNKSCTSVPDVDALAAHPRLPPPRGSSAGAVVIEKEMV